jgi:hypothetical protein
VLNKDVDNGASTENVRVPSLSGDIKTLLPRFSMPNLDDKYVEQVAKKINDGTVVSPEPLMFDAATWKHQFWTKYKANMQKIMDHLFSAMKKLEGEITKAYTAWESDPEPDPKPGDKRSPKQLAHDEKQAKLEVKASDIIEQFKNFQVTCSKMEDTAQRFGLAKHGEADGLNCHLDPKEKEEAFKAMDKLIDLIQAKAGVLPKPGESDDDVKAASAIVDAWTAAPSAALMGSVSLRKDPGLHGERHRMRSPGIIHKASDFLTSTDCPLKERIRHATVSVQ